ncbi:MAG: peptidoglycan DD-metalloendopeptidase family protein [Spirochaetes bacterium]|nr:peptidoglycan DD-metalloendopeptidase family protein [Spirochaetota bacterium]MBU0955028.1 peptidoglycan DD-metalloendopeptidase family protein [Spirochaetota bacterium]
MNLSPQTELSTILARQPKCRLLPFDPDSEPCVLFDFSAANPAALNLDTGDIKAFKSFVNSSLAAAGSRIGLGGYCESRVIYRHSSLFEGSALRDVHLGLDLWTAAGTPVLAPFAATVYSLADNAGVGNYGPTIILRHELEACSFFTLYGHLSAESLGGKSIGQSLAVGEVFAEIGDAPLNGNWPPHLHFQIMQELVGNGGDYPGVCAAADLPKYRALCPDPNLVLKLRILGPQA